MISEPIVRASTSLLMHLAEPAGRAIALGCVAAIVLGALRVKRVPLRLLAWTTVLYGAVAIALVGWLLPGVTMRVPGMMTAEKIAEKSQAVRSAIETLKNYADTKDANTSRDAVGLNEAGVTSREAPQEKQSGPPRQAGVEFRQSPANPAGIHEADRRTPQEAKADSSHSVADRQLEMTAQADNARLKAAATTDSKTRADSSSRLNTSGLGMTGRTSRQISWVVVAAGIYAAIALLLLARLLLGLALSHRLARLSEPIRDADAVRKLRFRAYASGLETVPKMAESEMVSVPATLGVLRPQILLPAEWREWDEAKLDAILAHEVSHVARRDSLTQRISLIHRAIFWFSPLAWWLDRKLNELAEEASDEAALGAGADKKRYAETLLGFFADLEAASGRVWWQGVSMASDGSRAGHAEKRVERILAWGGSISMKKSLAVALVAIAAPVIFVAAAVHPVIAQDKTQDDSKNVILPGGPKRGVQGGVAGGVQGGVATSAPAMPNAPKGGVIAPIPVAPAMAAAPEGGVTGSAPAAPAIAGAPQGGVGGGQRVRVSGDAEAKLLALFVPPVYPPIAQAAHIQGVVVLDAVIAKDGTVNQIQYVSGPPLLMHSAMDAVRQWKYRPFILNGNALEVETTVAVPFLQPRAPMPTAPRAGVVGPTVPPLPAPPPEAHAQVHSAGTASVAPVPPEPPIAALGPVAEQSDEAREVRHAEAAVSAAKKQVDEARNAVPRNEEAIREAEQDMQEAQKALSEARQAMREAQDQDNSTTITNGSLNIGSGPRYVMMSRNSNAVNMSGDEEDLQHARELRKKINSDFIWFERDEKSYIITDPNFIAQAKALFAPEDALAKQQDELGRQQDELGRQQDALGEKMESVKVKIRDITPELEEVRARVKELSAQGGATQEELGQLQSRLGELQSEVGRSQSSAGVSQSEIGRMQAELGRKQGELGRRQGELGRQQGEIAKKASRQLREMFEDAIAKGIAKPE